MTMHVNKVHHVTTITQVAKDLGEDEDWLRDVANEMEIEDGVIWVYGVGEDGIQAFTDFGIETLSSSSRCIKKIPNCSGAEESQLLCGLRRMLTLVCSAPHIGPNSAYRASSVQVTAVGSGLIEVRAKRRMRGFNASTRLTERKAYRLFQ
jgi:hypothetical protein